MILEMVESFFEVAEKVFFTKTGIPVDVWVFVFPAIMFAAIIGYYTRKPHVKKH